GTDVAGADVAEAAGGAEVTAGAAGAEVGGGAAGALPQAVASNAKISTTARRIVGTALSPASKRNVEQRGPGGSVSGPAKFNEMTTSFGDRFRSKCRTVGSRTVRFSSRASVQRTPTPRRRSASAM